MPFRPNAPARVLGPFLIGDDILIRMGEFQDPDYTQLYATVDANGNVTVNEIGAVEIAGRTADVIAAEVAGRLAEAHGGKQTAVDVHFDPRSSHNKSAYERRDDWQPRVIAEPVDDRRVYVLGEVKSPGEFAWEDGVTVQRAIALAGGAKPEADLKRVKILRPDSATGKATEIKVSELTMFVKPGDTVVVLVKYFAPTPLTEARK